MLYIVVAGKDVVGASHDAGDAGAIAGIARDDDKTIDIVVHRIDTVEVCRVPIMEGDDATPSVPTIDDGKRHKKKHK